MRHVRALPEIGRDDESAGAELLDGLRDVLGVDLRPVREKRERRVRPGLELKEADLDHPAHVDHLLRLRHGQARHVGEAVRDDDVLYAELARTLGDRDDSSAWTWPVASTRFSRAMI
jgi:hypothetical protein